VAESKDEENEFDGVDTMGDDNESKLVGLDEDNEVVKNRIS